MASHNLLASWLQVVMAQFHSFLVVLYNGGNNQCLAITSSVMRPLRITKTIASTPFGADNA